MNTLNSLITPKGNFKKKNSIYYSCSYLLILPFIVLICALSMQSFAQADSINPNGLNVFRYADGTISSKGYFKNGKPTGYWETYHENGELKSAGKRKQFELDSVWVFYRNDGIKLQEVTYSKGKKEGLTWNYNEAGLLTSKVPYVNDLKDGKALYFFPETSHLQFERPFKAGKLQGIGYEFNAAGDVITIITYEKGFVKEQDLINRRMPRGKKSGVWISFWEDLRDKEGAFIKRIEGRYNKGLKNGYFREYDKEGVLVNTTKYINGEVVTDALELKHVEIQRDFHDNARVKWEKTFFDGEPHGIWKEYDSTGVIINSLIYQYGRLLGEGIIDSAGIKQGDWIEYYADGSVRAKGAYQDGERFSKWIFYHENGEIEQTGKYGAGGRERGEWRWYFNNGDLHRVENFRKGLEDGPLTEYNSAGKVVLQGDFIDGLETGPWYIEMGDYKEEGAFIDGQRHGEWIHTYLRNDEVAYEGEYIDGNAHGKHTWYYPNGKKMLEGKYEMGLKDGDWKRYNEQGIIMLTITYKEGADKRVDGKRLRIKKSKSNQED